MQVRKNTEVLEITHDELVNLFSTALYGSSYLSAEYNKEFYNSLPKEKRIGDCFEDKLADCLLNGGEIYLYDEQSEGEVYSSVGEANEEEGYTQYTITLVDVIEGLQKAANGTYKVANDSKWVAECFSDFEEEGDGWDLYEADALMQIILFNELVYG